MLTAVARAELYTAKNSPVVDAASLQALIAQAPELPEANQLGLMALRRNPAAAPMVIPEKQTVVLGSAPVRYRAHPVQGELAADQMRSQLDPYVKADDASGRKRSSSRRARRSRRGAGRGRTRVAFIYYVLGLDMDARRVSDTWRQGAVASGQARRLGYRPSPRGGSATTTPPRSTFSRPQGLQTSGSCAPAVIIGPRARNRRRGARPPLKSC